MAFIFQRMLTVVSSDQCVHVEILNWFPCIVTVWVPLPLDQILKPSHLTKESMIDDGLDLVFRVFINEVQGRV